MNNKAKTDGRESRDDQIGRLVSGALRQQTVTGACPPEETLARLIENRLEGTERERLLAHLAGCDRCLATLKLTSELNSSSAGRTASRGGWLCAGAGIAAVAMIALVIFIRPQIAPDMAGREMRLQSAHRLPVSGASELSSQAASWAAETLKAAGEKAPEKIDRNRLSRLTADAKSAKSPKAPTLEAIERHLAISPSGDQWYQELENLCRKLNEPGT